VVGVSDGISGSKVMTADANGGGSFGCMRSPYASVVAIPIAWRKAERMLVRLETCHLLAGVRIESRWESRNMTADLWGSGSSGTEGANILIPARPSSGSARIW
jgi:hypothetical protein